MNPCSWIRILSIFLFHFCFWNLLAEPPQIFCITKKGQTVWTQGQSTPLKVKAGETIVLEGNGFGQGPDQDYGKVLVGKIRALERDLFMYEGEVSLLKEHFYEKPKIFDSWERDIFSWSDSRIEMRVPPLANEGPLVISLQKKLSTIPSLNNSAKPHLVLDPLIERIEGKIKQEYYTVSNLSLPVLSNAVPLDVENSTFKKQVGYGQAIFWSYDFNMGLVHHLRGMDWKNIFWGRAVDPVTGFRADPEKLFGAIPLNAREVPPVVVRENFFSPYPIPMPIDPLLRSPLLSGTTYPTGYVGYVAAESIHPISQSRGEWVGFNCAACHSQKITYQDPSGAFVTKVFPGLPNPGWSMKWSVLSDFKGVRIKERTPSGKKEWVDKTRLLYGLPSGAGEHSMIRESEDGSQFGNDYSFSPIAFPIITRHTPVRRALSHAEKIAGFEGSYIHSEEPDGAIGAMRADSLKALTAYMSVLDQNDSLLESLALYRWVRENGKLSWVGNVSEGEFIKNRKSSYPLLMDKMARGKKVFERDCASCHADNFGTYTDENMISLKEVGSYFAPTVYQAKHLSVRTAILKNLYWLQKRGLLHDGHVKNVEDLVDADRCEMGTEVYNRYYQLNEGTFRISKGNREEERATRYHRYFVDVPWDRVHLYWDYQKMRKDYGTRELGSAKPLGLPATPHPWCVKDNRDKEDLVVFLMGL